MRIGDSAKVTTGHTLDLTRSISIGDFSIVAGKASQFWTHGYYHTPDPADRYRVDGRISIGRNAYVGSACVFSAGVHVADDVMIGAHSSVSRSLEEPGLYVSQPLRRLELDAEKARSQLERVDEERVCEPVYLKDRRRRT